MVQFFMVRVPPFGLLMPPTSPVLLEIVLSITVIVPGPVDGLSGLESFAIPPPLKPALLLEILLLMTMVVPVKLAIPPPALSGAEFLVIVQLVTVRFPPGWLHIPPPDIEVVLPKMSQLTTERMPKLLMAPPPIVKAPGLKPLPPVRLSPDTVTEADPPIENISPLLLPLTVSSEAPGPVMVIESLIVMTPLVSVIVWPLRPGANSIVSLD